MPVPASQPPRIDLGTLRLSPFLYPNEASEHQDLIARDMIEDVTDEQRRQKLRPGATPMGSENTTMQRAIKRMEEVCATVTAFLIEAPGQGATTREISDGCALKLDKCREAILRLIEGGTVSRVGTNPYRYAATARKCA